MSVAEDRRRVDASACNVLQVGAVVVFAVLAMSFWFLQVIEHKRYEELAENNHQRTLALRAPRGVLFDRNGTVLVENRHSFTISIVREHSTDLTRTVELLSQVAGLDPTQVRADRRAPPQRAGLPADRGRGGRVAGAGGGGARPGASTPSCPTSSSRKCRRGGIPPTRWRRTSSATSARPTTRRWPPAPRQGAIIGQQGLEKAYNDLLMGQRRRQASWSSTASAARSGRSRRCRPVEGRRVQLTIDADLQRAAEDGFRHAGFNGAALILDPRNGEVLTYASLPAYDPNDFAVGIDRATWASLNTDKLRPLQNRVLQGRYSPGSTFKIVVATAALEEGLVDARLPRHVQRRRARSSAATSSATSRAGTAPWTCATRIEKSCNVYFYTLGNMLGVDKIHKWAEKLGHGRARPASTCRTSRRASCPSTEWKLKRTGEKWYAGETISVSIGQGQVAVTPASLAVMISTVANGGTRVTPHVHQGDRRGAGLEAGAARRRWPTAWRSSPRRWPRCATACGWWSTAPAPAAAPGCRAATWPARPAPRR